MPTSEWLEIYQLTDIDFTKHSAFPDEEWIYGAEIYPVFKSVTTE